MNYKQHSERVAKAVEEIIGSSSQRYKVYKSVTPGTSIADVCKKYRVKEAFVRRVGGW